MERRASDLESLLPPYHRARLVWGYVVHQDLSKLVRVSVNCHAINDFRAGNATLMDELLSDNVAALAAAGAISLERVAQDEIAKKSGSPSSPVNYRKTLVL